MSTTQPKRRRASGVAKAPRKVGTVTRKVMWSWGNWTFGFWFYSPSSRTRTWGVDLGPLEVLWRRSY